MDRRGAWVLLAALLGAVAVYRTLVDDLAKTTKPAEVTGREGNEVATLTPARPAHNPNTGTSDKPLRGPSPPTLGPHYPGCLDTEGSHERSTSQRVASPQKRHRRRQQDQRAS